MLRRKRKSMPTDGGDKAKPAAGGESLPPEDTSRSVDRFLKLSGLALAVVCGLLPWAAYRQNAASMKTMAANDTKIHDPLDRSHQHTILGSRGIFGDQAKVADLPVDPNPTGTTSITGDIANGRPKAEPPAKQPFPARPEFLLRDVVGGMGMIEDQTGFWFVEKGSLLPDASRVVSITSRKGLWQITTDTGRVIRQTP